MTELKRRRKDSYSKVLLAYVHLIQNDYSTQDAAVEKFMKRSRMKATGIVIDQEVSESSSEDLNISDILYDGAGEEVSTDESENEEGSYEESDDSEDSSGSAIDSDADDSFDSELYS